MSSRVVMAGLGLLALAGLTTLAFIFGEGELIPALGPLMAAIALFGVLRFPPRYTLCAMVFLALIADNPMEKPANGLWKSALYPLGRLLFVNLSKNLGVDALAFCLLDMLAILLLFLSWFRSSGRAELPQVRPLNQLLALSFGAFLFLELYGVIFRQGDFKNSLWQLRIPLMTPLVAYLFIRAFRTAEDFKALGVVLVLGSCIKALIGFYFFWFICRPMHVKPQYVTSHADTMIYATSIGLMITYWLETRSWRAVRLNAIVLPIIGIGMITNDRRLVFVSIFAGFFVMFMLLKRQVRLRFMRYGLASIPFLVIYFIAGMNSRSMVFMPVTRIMSVVNQEDRSSGTRDIENFNLIWTLKRQPVLGMGFGHEYDEIVMADSIAELFPQYKYIAHNSVLWLWAIGGIVFGALWLYLAASMYLCVRSYRHAVVPQHRVMAMTAIFAIIAYQLQAWGDMGMQSWTGIWLAAGATAVASRLAMASGAWSAPGDVAT